MMVLYLLAGLPCKKIIKLTGWSDTGVKLLSLPEKAEEAKISPNVLEFYGVKWNDGKELKSLYLNQQTDEILTNYGFTKKMPPIAGYAVQQYNAVSRT